MRKRKKHVCIVGAAIIDLMGFTEHEIKISDSVPGSWKEAPGGVGRNIAENLARLGVSTNLITAFGDDPFSKILIADALKSGIELSRCLYIEGGKAATFIAILDKANDLHTGIAALDIIQELNVAALKSRLDLLMEADIVIADTNIPEESLRWLSEHPDLPEVYLDLVSMKLAEKVKSFYGNFHSVKANKYEAELLTGISLENAEDFKFAAHKMIDTGLERIFITAGKRGVFYADRETDGWARPVLVEVQNTTGAGDAFMSGITFASIHGKPIHSCATTGLAAAAIALKSTRAVNPDINEQLLSEYLGYL
jgi:pseudouridine kinase